MKRILIKFIIFHFIFLISFASLEAALKTNSFVMKDDCYVEEGRQLVYISNEGDACVLNCFGGGNLRCCFSCAEDCLDCGDSYVIFENALGEEMFDYMHEQILLNQLFGTYNNNIVFWPTNTTYYRTITWNYNPFTDYLEATLYISYEE